MKPDEMIIEWGGADIAVPADQVMTLTRSDEIFSVHGEDNERLVTMYRDGRMVFGPKYEPESAARIWWDAVARLMPLIQ